MLNIKHSWSSILQNIVGPTHPSFRQLLRLVVPFGRSPSIRRHAASVIMARVQLICFLFAWLVPLCAIVDWWVFDAVEATRLTILRFIAGAVFAVLAWPRDLPPRRPYRQAMRMLFCMLLVPSLFYLGVLLAVDIASLTEEQRLVVQLYALMPTIVLGGLAIFPLSALEILLLSLPALTTAVAGLQLSDHALSLTQHGATLWFMCMMTGVSMFSGMSQSHYMESLVHQATTDPLTGALTRRSGVETLERLFLLAEQADAPLALAFFDIDHFKSINDQFGHDAGDQALRSLVAELKKYLRRGDALVRWGGEEFVVVLPEMAVSQLPIFLGRIQAGGLGQRLDGRALAASVGIAERRADGAGDWTSLVELADHRMYQAKHEGRSCAVMPDHSVVKLTIADRQDLTSVVGKS
ncbi:MAG: GGDEF domain-containing protein [Corticimicrobacter sp.]|uniref:GGDEF domain-containing protein n=1 Tax=Corticimicrobacter sp. TaxID=2678536 RepID=UPI0032DB20F7